MYFEQYNASIFKYKFFIFLNIKIILLFFEYKLRLNWKKNIFMTKKKQKKKEKKYL